MIQDSVVAYKMVALFTPGCPDMLMNTILRADRKEAIEMGVGRES
jgi:hypothetical protein